MGAIDHLQKEFGRLPGIGPKTATRLVYHLLKGGVDDLRRLASALREVSNRVRQCRTCGNFSEEEECEICLNPRRDRGLLCVVEEAHEVAAIERTGAYRGLFHVLGGRLSPLDGIGPEELSIPGLLERVQKAEPEVAEVILATNTNLEGEATAVYLESAIRPLGPRVTRLARGIPLGSDLDYVDGNTLAEALAGRREA